MSAGEQVNKSSLDSRLASVTRTVYIAMRETKQLQTYLAATADLTLTSMGYSSSDVADMKSAFSDLDELRKIWDGLANSKLTGTYAFQTFPSRLIGDGVF